MAIIAIAGGQGDLGRTIVEEIVKTGKHQVFVLSRGAGLDCDFKNEPDCYPVKIKVNYDDVTELSKVLQQVQADTVISAINLHWPGAPESQLNLIRAAAVSGVVTRFVPSEFNIDYHAPEDAIPYPPRIEFVRAEEELMKYPQLTFTLVRNGFFMDYLGLPYARTHLHPLYCIVDIDSEQIVIPGDGEQPVVFTHTQDIGKFVEALMNVPASSWPRESTIVGDRVTLIELVDIVRNITGREFQVAFDTVEDLRNNITTELPSNQRCHSYFSGGKDELNGIITTQMISMTCGVFDIKGASLNEMFPEIGTIRLRKLIQGCYNGKRSG